MTIIGGAIGEWNYFGSTVEVVPLAAIAFYAWTWPQLAVSGSRPARPSLLIGTSTPPRNLAEARATARRRRQVVAGAGLTRGCAADPSPA